MSNEEIINKVHEALDGEFIDFFSDGARIDGFFTFEQIRIIADACNLMETNKRKENDLSSPV